MKKIYYPAVFHPEEIGYSVTVPDIPGCFTQGDSLEEAVEMASDAIGLCLEEGETFKASLPNDISCAPGEFVVLIEFDQISYFKKHDTKAVKKTLTIPSWLNSLAEEQHINFSSLLQAALKERLNVE